MNNNLKSFIIRYILIIILSIPNVFLFYYLFRIPTIYSVYYIILPFKAAEVVGQSIFLNSIKINFIDACIAGSAYYLLLVLNLSTPSIKRRIYYLVFSFLIFFVINTARILFLIFVLSSVPKYFGLAHMTLWYLASTFIVVGIWFLQVKLFDIKEIPFYSDIRYLLKLI